MSGWHELIGLAGVALILLAYGALQLDRLPAQSLAYSVLNAVGAAAILLSLTVDYNLSAIVIESAWLLISAFGIVRWHRRRKRTPVPDDS